MHEIVSLVNIATKGRTLGRVCRQISTKTMMNVTERSVTKVSWRNKTSSIQSVTISSMLEMILL